MKKDVVKKEAAVNEVALEPEEIQADSALEEAGEIVETQRKYNCEVDVLYDVCYLAWDHYDPVQALFFAKSEVFTVGLSTTSRTAIAAADALPDNETRMLVAKNALTEMRRLNPMVTREFEFLEYYIKQAYPTTWEAEVASAGYPQYQQAIKPQWGSTESMVNKSKTYMTDHSADLLANNNMPVGFPAAFNALGEEFKLQRKTRNNALGISGTGTADKIVANNAIYEHVMWMMEMGKLIYKNNKTEYNKFVFDRLKNIVKGRKAAGAKGMVKADLAFTPIGNATLSARNLNPKAPQQSYSTMTDADGNFFLEMASGEYEITVVAPNFDVVVVPKFRVKIGTKSRLYPLLAAVPVGSELVQAMTERVVAPSELAAATLDHAVASLSVEKSNGVLMEKLE